MKKLLVTVFMCLGLVGCVTNDQTDTAHALLTERGMRNAERGYIELKEFFDELSARWDAEEFQRLNAEGERLIREVANPNGNVDPADAAVIMREFHKEASLLEEQMKERRKRFSYIQDRFLIDKAIIEAKQTMYLQEQANRRKLLLFGLTEGAATAIDLIGDTGLEVDE